MADVLIVIGLLTLIWFAFWGYGWLCSRAKLMGQDSVKSIKDNVDAEGYEFTTDMPDITYIHGTRIYETDADLGIPKIVWGEMKEALPDPSKPKISRLKKVKAKAKAKPAKKAKAKAKPAKKAKAKAKQSKAKKGR